MAAQPKPLTPDRSARHLFGAKMREHREQVGMSLDALSLIVNISKAHLSRIEHAESPIPPGLPPLLDREFNTETFTNLFVVAAKEVHPDKYQRRMSLEAQATVIKEYTPQIVPGMLQTEDYARAQFRTHNPKASAQEIEDLVTGRMSRVATLLGDPQPDYSAVLDEGVLRRGYGGPVVMRDQLTKLADICLTPSTCLQVLPFSYGGHALAGGSLSLWTLRNGALVAYEEAITTGTLLEEAGNVAAKFRAYDLLSASALSPGQSADFIRSVLEDLPNEHHP
ncbi:helix-turn-helix domain-containing protein [Streptomyces sp. 4F14]|uniref:helix-turn-helix domain-containing protein n=1 Tax=Streptomyces sp. 4F14 TaxID=3394380 RepID=UPI003A863383